MDESHAGPDRQNIPPFMTTEHFTLQTARGVANAEVSARLQLYMSTLSSTIISLALAAQLAGLESAFLAFAVVLLPVVYLLGLVTLGRLRQVSAEWRIYGQVMNRIRHYFLEVAPEMKPYFIMPTTDDPWASLEGVGIPGTGQGICSRREWWWPLSTVSWPVSLLGSWEALRRLDRSSGPVCHGGVPYQPNDPQCAAAAGCSIATLKLFRLSSQPIP